MTRLQKISIVLLRVTMGWFFLYAGISHIMNPNFTAAGYLATAKVFPSFYHWLASPVILPIINFINEWALTLLGLSLVFGISIRLSTTLGIVLMLLYRIPLGILYPDAHSLIVDDHIIYILVLLFLQAIDAGNFWSVESWFLHRKTATIK